MTTEPLTAPEGVVSAGFETDTGTVREMRLFSYKMTHDTGFAPNPFGCTLTLATCKPKIRLHKDKGDWIAGFTSKGLTGDKVGSERLIYLMRVAEKLLIRDYFSGPRFQDKIPDMCAKGPQAKAGDNIYRPLRPGAVVKADFEQLPNANHRGKAHQKRDVSGQYVLIADEFYYFGGSALEVPDDYRPTVPEGQSGHGRKTPPSQAQRFIDYVRGEYQPGHHGAPHRWPNVSDAEGKQCG